MGKLIHASAQLTAFPVGGAVQFLPETRPVVHLAQVGQFVLQYIVNQLSGCEQEPKGEVDVLQRGAAAPTSVYIFDGAAVILVAILLRQLLEAFGQKGAGVFAEHTDEHLVGPLLRRRTVKPKAAGQHHDGVAGRLTHVGRGESAFFKVEVEEVGVDAKVVAEGELHKCLLRASLTEESRELDGVINKESLAS